MGITVMILSALIAYATLTLLTRHDGIFALVAPLPNHPTSPLDEAERILALRYATGEITSEEYDRMLVIVRR